MHAIKSRRKLLFGLLTVVPVLLLAEAAARVALSVHHDLQSPDPWYVYSKELGWERRPGYSGEAYGSPRSFDAEGYVSADTHQLSHPNKRTVLFLGDSTTFGHGVPTEQTFVELIDRDIPDAQCINLGVPGYTSYQGYVTLLKYGTQLDPALIVASFNFNDRRYVLRSSDVDGESHFEKLGRRSRTSLLEKVYLFRVFSGIASRFGALERENRPTNINLENVVPRVSPAEYRLNLEKIAAWASERGTPVIFVLLNDDPVRTSHLRTGIGHYKEGRLLQAVEHLRAARMGDKWFSPLAQVYLAQAYDGLGNSASASVTRVLKHPFRSIHGGPPIHTDEDYHKIMRDVAEQYGVGLVDAGSRLDEDPATYCDYCHFNAYGHRIVADLVGPLIAEVLSREGVRERMEDISALPHRCRDRALRPSAGARQDNATAVP